MVLQEKLSIIPKSSGCYLFKDDKNQIIYVGKSKYLPNRVMSYFRENHDDEKVKVLREKIRDVDFITTINESEALLLEDDLIKLYRPKFNIKGKDDRSRRWYIGLTGGDFPKLEVFPKLEEGIEVLGEFTNSNTCYEVYETIYNVISLRTCSYNLSKSNIESQKFRPCLDFHIGKCDAPCSGNINKFIYIENVKMVRELFEFKFDNIESKLKKLLNEHSKRLEFEKCEKFKHKLEYFVDLKKLLEPLRVKHVIELSKNLKTKLGLKNTPLIVEAFDNSHNAGDCQVSCSVRYVNGLPEKNSYRKFNIKTVEGPDDYASFDEVLNRRLKRLMKEKGVLPSMILIDGGKGQLNVAIKVLQELDLFDKIDLISISKNDNHKSDTIHLTNGQSIKMEHEESFFQLARIQDEVHRFTINFHRKKRNKKLIS